jgi:hypothetical protein
LANVGKVNFERKTAENTGETSNIAKIANFAKFACRRFFFDPTGLPQWPISATVRWTASSFFLAPVGENKLHDKSKVP